MISFLFGPPAKQTRNLPLDDPEAWRPLLDGMRQTKAGVRISHESALTYSACWCASRIIAETVASLPLFLYERLPNGDRQPAAENPLFDLMKFQPNEDMGAMAFREGRTMHQVNWGNGFAEIVRENQRDPNSPVRELWPIHPSRVWPTHASTVNKRGERMADEYPYTVYNDDGTTVGMRSRDMLHVPGVFPDDGVWGRGVIDYARESMGMGLGTEYQAATRLGPGNVPTVIIFAPGVGDATKRRTYREEWREAHGAPDKANVGLLPAEAKAQVLDFSQRDMQVLESRRHNVLEIARWYRLPPHMLAELGRATHSNVEEMGIEFVIYCLLPWLLRWEQQCNLKLLNRQDRKKFYFEHLLANLLRGDTAKRYDAYQKAINTGWLSPNDVRRMENLPSMGPAGDQHMQQGAMTTLERIHKGLPSPSAIKPEQPAATEAAPAKEKGDERNSDRSRAGLPDDSRPQLLLPGPGGSGEANQALAREAARAVLADALGRLLTKEAHAVERAAKGNRFDQWVGTFYPKHKGEVAAALKPAAHAAAAAGISLDVTEQADEICRQSRQDLSAAYSADTPQQFAERLAKWSERAAGIVERILGNA